MVHGVCPGSHCEEKPRQSRVAGIKMIRKRSFVSILKAMWLRRPSWLRVSLRDTVIFSIAVSAVWFTWGNWGWLIENPERSAVIPNIVVPLIALISLLFKNYYVDAANHRRLDDFYQKAADALGSDSQTIRFRGMSDLKELADKNTGEYHVKVMQSLCRYVRQPPPLPDGDVMLTLLGPGPALVRSMKPVKYREYREDINVAMKIIGRRDHRRIALEEAASLTLDLRGSDLRDQDLRKLNFSGVDLSNANLAGSVLRNTNFSHSKCVYVRLTRASLWGTDFSQTNLSDAQINKIISCHGADFSGATMYGANFVLSSLAGAKFHGAKFTGANITATCFCSGPPCSTRGVTMNQLCGCNIRLKHRPPHLNGLIDEQTKKPIVSSMSCSSSKCLVCKLRMGDFNPRGRLPSLPTIPH